MAPLLLPALLLLLVSPCAAWAQALQLPFTSCSVPGSASYNASRRIHVDAVYGQLVHHTPSGVQERWLNFTILGYTNDTIEAVSTDTGKLSTMFTNTTLLTFDIFNDTSFFCSNVRPTSPLPYQLLPGVNSTNYLDANATYCPVSPGPIAFSASVPLGQSYELTTLTTQIRVVDTSSPPVELACVDINTSPMPTSDGHSNRFGPLTAILWFTVGLTIAYWAVIGMARISAAWRRGGGRRGGIAWSDIRWAGTVLASAISGERLAASPALLRFCTPMARDIFMHTQWSFALGLVAVQWPQFAYPVFGQVAWASLIYNITLTQGTGPNKHWDPLTAPPVQLPTNFSDQIQDVDSPLYLDLDAPNYLLTFPSDAGPGLASLAAVIGVRPQDLFGICVGLFLIILGGVFIVSLLVWVLSWLTTVLSGPKPMRTFFFGGTRSPSYSGPLDMPKEFPDLDGGRAEADIHSSGHGHSTLGHMGTGVPRRKHWWSYRLGQGSFHGNVLHGNLVRLLILFHFPITTFSVYQLSLGRAGASLPSLVLAGLTFAIISLIIPVLLLLRIATVSTPKLYDATRTLLAFGPLYNTYMQKSQMFACVPFLNSLVTGIAIGAAQKSGIAQAIIILIVEVLSALATSIFLPWGKGAQMGIISFSFVVGRIATAVLLVILSPTVAVGTAAGGWVTVAVFIIQGLIFVQFFLMLIMKILEGFVRLITGVSFDKSAHSYDSGLVGAIGLGCFPERHKKRRRKRRSQAPTSSTANSQQTMLAPSPSPSQLYTPVLTAPPAPRSFLKPEHASRPYQETLDDDAQFSIMRAWQPFPQYTAVNSSPLPSSTSHERLDLVGTSHAPPAPTAPPVQQTGFTRVRGGRANFESPYSMIAPSLPPPGLPKGAAAPMTAAAAIASSPSQTSLTRMGGGPRPPSPGGRSALAAARAASVPGSARSSPTVPPSSWPGPGSQVVADEPPAPRLHVRTKSQTAIIEDASLLQSLQASPVGTPSRQVGGTGFPDLTASTSRLTLPGTREAPLPPPSAPLTLQDDSKRRRRWFKGLSNVEAQGESDDEGDSPSNPVPFAESSEKPRGWFRRNRRRSEGDVLASSTPRLAALEQTRTHTQQPQEQTAPGSGRSFVVMRPMRVTGGSSGALPTLASQQEQQRESLPVRPSSSGDAEGQSSPALSRMSMPAVPRKSSKRRPSSSGN